MVAGVATIAFSLVVSIAPAMAAKGGNGNDNGNANGNAGVAKVHDATTDLEAGEQGNEPWVCTFWVGFYASNPTEAGTWQILNWPPTGDGTVVASGTYDTAGDGVDGTGDLALAEGHYRLEWQTATDSNVKHKTFWVECEATEAESDPTDEAAPTDEPAPTDEAAPSGDEEVQGEEQTPPTDEAEPTDEAAPTDEAGPDEENPDETDEAAPTPEEDVLAGNPGPVASPETPEGGAAPADGGATELPDTSIPAQSSGVLATIGVLLIIAAHRGARRTRSLPAA